MTLTDSDDLFLASFSLILEDTLVIILYLFLFANSYLICNKIFFYQNTCITFCRLAAFGGEQATLTSLSPSRPPGSTLNTKQQPNRQ